MVTSRRLVPKRLSMNPTRPLAGTFVLSILAAACGGSTPSARDAAAAGPWTWRNVNLQGMGDVNGLVVHPDTVHAPNLVYARTNVGGAYRFEPSSNSWTPLLDAFGPIRDMAYYVESIAVDPNRPDDVYAVVDGQTHYTPDCTVDPGDVLISHDRGATWTATQSFGAYVFANDPGGDTSGERLVIDPFQPGLGYFASHKDGLWMLSNGAWTRVTSPGLPAPTTCTPDCNLTCDPSCSLDCFAGDTFVVFDPTAGTIDGAARRLYLGIWTSGVYVSDDGGATFSLIGPDLHPVRGSVGPDGALYVSFGQPEAGYTGPGGVRAYRPLGSGQWSDTDITPPAGTGVSYSGISADANHASTVVVSTNDARIYRSTDGGQSWGAYPVTTATAPPWYWRSTWMMWGGALVLDPNDPAGLAAWRTDGFAVSHTSDLTSETWAATMQGFEELVALVVRTPDLPHVQLYAGVADATGFADADRTMVPERNLAPPEGSIQGASSFDVCASRPTAAAYVGWDELSNPPVPITGLTTDGGATFTPFADTSPGYAGCVAMASNDPTDLVWEPTNATQPYYSTDAGGSWTPSTLSSPTESPGISFYRISQWFNAQTLASDKIEPGVFYYLSHSQGAAAAVHFWVSTDGGRTFVDQGALFAAPQLYTSTAMIKPSPVSAGDVWVTFGKNDGSIGALYRSTDTGASFQRVTTVDAAYQIAFGKGRSPSTPALYLFGRVGGTSADTMYRSDDLARTWTPISDPSIERFGLIQYLEGDMNVDGLVYVALAGRGILYGSAQP